MRIRLPKGSRLTLCSVAAAVVLALGTGGSWAQDEPSTAVRLSAMEDQMRQLYGQIEQLNIQILQLTEQMQQLQEGGGGKRKISEAQQPPQAQNADSADDGIVQDPAPARSLAPDDDLYAYQTGELERSGQGTESIGGTPDPLAPQTDMITGGLEQAPGPQPLGTLPSAPAGQSEVKTDPGQPVVPEQVETASLDSDAPPQADTPEKLYELSYESLLRRRYGEAEAGFRTFMQKHPEHELAGNAGFWLGETYYVQSNYKAAAQAFLGGYQTYPTNRKAPDSLLRLGMSLNQLGQKDQACAAFATVEAKFPKAMETRKRAQDESDKAGC
jgi:tol-pal system protein YbgF